MSLRIALVSLSVCLFFGSPVLADECSESLMAESCTCQSATKTALAKPLRSDKRSSIHAAARVSSKPATHVGKHPPVITPPAD